MPDISSIPNTTRFTETQPVMPGEPRLRLQEYLTQTNSGVRNLSRNKKEQQKILARMNTKIQTNNEKRLARYERQKERYAIDSASYPNRLKQYNTSKLEYVDYYLATRQQLDTLRETYFRAIIKKRLCQYVKQLLQASDNGTLRNGDLIKKARIYCLTDNLKYRDTKFERELYYAYGNLELKRTPAYVELIYFDPRGNSLSQIFNALIAGADVKPVLTQLIDDNPYLSDEERRMQKASLERGNNPPAYTMNAVSYYSATVGQLGYVNCDRLREIENVVALDIEGLNTKAESVAFIKGINASQTLNPFGNKFKKNEEVVLLSVFFENGRPQVAYNSVKLSDSQKMEFKYKEMTAAEFKQLVLSIAS